MRNFIPYDGVFEIKLPTNWIYELRKGFIHKFDFENSVGSFFLSILGEQGRQSFKKISNNPKVIRRKFNDLKVFEISMEENNNNFNTILWFFEKVNVLFQASYTYLSSFKDNEEYNNELNYISEIIGSIRIIPENDREQRINWYRFSKFLEGIAASEELYNRAVKNGSFIEGVCLLANQIDSMLRTANILNDQINNEDSKINLSLIYQGVNDKIISEKDIYKLSKNKSIINQQLFDELHKIYEERNKVVHRYIISEITTKDILNIAIKYSEIKEKIWNIVYNLETKQMELGIGITTSEPKLTKEQIKETKQIFRAALKEKHGGIDLNVPPL